MIIKKKLKKRLPISKLLSFYNLGENLFKYGWKQHTPNDPNNWKALDILIADILGIQPYKVGNCVLHAITEDVYSHKDNLSTGVYLIPLRFSKTCEFYVEDKSVNFEKGFVYKFNDSLTHGISNPHNANLLILSVDT